MRKRKMGCGYDLHTTGGSPGNLLDCYPARTASLPVRWSNYSRARYCESHFRQRHLRGLRWPRHQVFTGDHTEVWKGKTSHDLSIELNVVNVFGIITKVEGGGEKFEMSTNPNADPKSGYERKVQKVVVDSATIFTASAKEDLKAGRDIQMVGLDLRNGAVRATRVTVYEGKWPVRMQNGKVMPTTGPPK